MARCQESYADRWDWETVIMSNCISIFHIYNDHLLFAHVHSGISTKRNVAMQDVLTYPDLPWNFYMLSENPAITLDDISRNTNLPWIWSRIYTRSFREEKKQLEKGIQQVFNCTALFKKQLLRMFIFR